MDDHDLNQPADLPPEVVAALRRNRKIEAIRLLREQRHIDLKTAKEAVEAYTDAHPHPRSRTGRGPETGA